MEFLKHYFKNIQFLSLSLSLFLYIHKNSNKKWRNFCFDGKEFEIIQFACVDFSFVFLHSVVFTRAESTPESFHVLCISISLFQSKLKQPNHPKSSQIIPNHPKSSQNHTMNFEWIRLQGSDSAENKSLIYNKNPGWTRTQIAKRIQGRIPQVPC